jgi:polysaccharide biosynthesis transport protein
MEYAVVPQASGRPSKLRVGKRQERNLVDNEKARRKPVGWRLGALVLVTGLLAGAAIGLGVGVRAADTYIAQASVLVSPLDGNPYSPNGNGEDLVNLETEAQLAGSAVVAEAVAQDVRAPSSASLLHGLEIDVPANTQIVEIAYTAREPIAAERRAQSFATSYLEFRADRANNVVDGRATTIQDQLNTQTTELNSLLRKKDATGAQVRRSILQEQIEGTTKQIGRLRTALTGVRTVSADPGQIISPARIVSRDPQLTQWLFVAGGALVGLAAAMLILLSRARRSGSGDTLPESFSMPRTIEPLPRSAEQQRQNA